MAAQELVRRAQGLKSKGLSTYEIADELKVQPDTVVWLLLRGKERAARPTPYDVYVDWSSVGSHVKRMSSVAAAMADLVRESVRIRAFGEPDVIVAIEGSGMVLGVAVAKELDKPLAAVRPPRTAREKITGLVNPSFHTVSGRKVLVVDSVLRAGGAITSTLQTLQKAKARPVGVLVLVDKSGKPKIGGLPLKSLIQLLPVAPLSKGT